MASLTQRGGKYYKKDGDQWQELSAPEYQKQIVMQQMVQSQSHRDRFAAGVGKYASDLISGGSELIGGAANAQEQQQSRADLQQRYQPTADYGGASPVMGEFAGSAASAAIPGGLAVQTGIGALQGAMENPGSPWAGAGIGGAMTLASDWLTSALGRIGTTMTAKRQMLSPSPDYRQQVIAGQNEGLQFTPGQIADDPARRIMENQLRKTPRFADIDMNRFLNNQAKMNDHAARLIGETPTGRISPGMRGRAVEKVGKAFDDIATDSSPIELLGKDWVQEFGDLTDAGKPLHENFINRFPGIFEGQPVSGKQFVDARNWLAKQTRKTANWQSGAAEEMQPFLRIMDDSLEAANVDSNPMLVDQIKRARQIWKSNLVIEDSLRSANAAASGNLSAPSAYGALKKYDKGGIFRGRSRDPFSTIVDAMAATGDAAPSIMPSHDATARSVLKDMLWNRPGAESYMRGERIGDLMMGVTPPTNEATLEIMKKGGRGATRGALEMMDMLGEEDQPPGLMQ